jgi:hypothetical protein
MSNDANGSPILRYEVKEDGCGVREDLGQVATEVKIVLPVSHNALASAAEEYVQ